MSTDPPKKDDEIKDEELEKVSGGAKNVLDEQDTGGDSGSASSSTVKSRPQRH